MDLLSFPPIFSGLINLAYFVIGVLILCLIVLILNRVKATGESFVLRDWMERAYEGNVAVAIVLAGLFVALAIIGAAFIG